MSVPTKDFIWQQGDDGEVNIIYKINDVPVDLTNYSLRMDIRDLADTVIYTFNSDDVTGGDAQDVVGEADNEVDVMNAVGEIHINVPRAATLEGGPLVSTIGEALPYDIFLRNNTDDKQRKILRGTITFEPSTTLWN